MYCVFGEGVSRKPGKPKLKKGDESMLSIIGIIVAVIVMMLLYYYDFQPFFAGVIATAVLALFNGLPLIQTLCVDMVSGGVNVLGMIFSMTLPGAVLAQVYNESGAATAMAVTISGWFEKISGTSFKGRLHGALLTIEAIGAVLLLGGMNGFVVLFATYPIVLSLLKKLDLPRRYVVALTMGVTCWCNIVPGSPQMYNALVVNFVNSAGGKTTSTGALVPGLVSAAFMAVASYVYFYIVLSRDHAKGLVYVAGKNDPSEEAMDNPPNFFLSLLPLILVFVLYNAFQMDLGAACTLAFLLALVLFRKNFKGAKGMMDCVNRGVEFVSVTLIIVIAIAGFGSVLSSTSGFSAITNALLSATGNNPLVALAIAVVVLVGIQGNGNGGLQIAVPVLAPIFLKMGVDGQAIHRVSSIAATTLDSLPTNQGIITLLAMVGMKQRDTYGPVFVSTVVITSIATVICVMLCSMIY